MIWLSWRQLRPSAIVTGAALALVAVGLLVLGGQIRDTPTADLEGTWSTVLYACDALVLALPGLLGMFWGAPLVAREFEHGTHRLVWNQSVTRRRWLAVKLLVTTVLATAVTGLLSALLTWAASPVDQVAGDRFTALLFGTRNLAPLGYTVFAVVLGAALGLLLRRTVPAMALTMAVFIAVQVLVPLLVRPHLIAPVSGDQPMTAATFEHMTFLGADGTVGGFRVPGGFVVSTSRILGADGRPITTKQLDVCDAPFTAEGAQCLGQLHLHVKVRYQPARRYWPFQLAESAIFLALAGLFAGVSLWRVRPSWRPRRATMAA